MNEPDATPLDLETFKTFFFWKARESKGRLSKHSSITILQYQVGLFAYMCQQIYGIDISKDHVKWLEM